MAKIYDEEEIKNLEKQAALKQRQDAAMKILEPEKPDRVALIREHEQQRNDAWHKSNMDAKARRLEGMVATEAGRYNPQQQAAALKWLERNGYGQEGERRRQFDETQRTERIKAEQEAAGKIGYGKDAAKVKSDADIAMNKNEWKTREKIAEQEAAAKKYLAEQDAEAQKYGIDAEHGKIGADGKVTPGSRERTAKIQGQDQIKIEQERGKSALAQLEIQNLNAQLDRESKERIAQVTASGRFNASKVIAASREIAALTRDVLDPTEKAMIIAKYKEDNNDNPDAIAAADALGGGQQQQPAAGKIEKGTEKTFPNGDVGVWDGTKWVKKN